jgi:hypothetical protein
MISKHAALSSSLFYLLADVEGVLISIHIGGKKTVAVCGKNYFLMEREAAKER